MCNGFGRMGPVAGLLAVLLAACAAGPVPRSAPDSVVAADTAELRSTIVAAMDGYRGIAGVAVRNLRDGSGVSIRGHEPFPSASLIKVPVVVALLGEVEADRMALDEPITMLARDRVGGSGILKHMASGHSMTVEEAAWLMITLSDNTATNLLLDKLDIRTVWTRMEALGLPRSKIHSKTFRRETSIALDSSVIYGLGVTTPDETVELLSLLDRGAANSPALDSVAVAMMVANQDATMLRRWLPGGTRVANKSGSVDRARNDCGIVYGPEVPYAICVMTRENEDTSYAVDAEPHLLVARVSRAVFAHFHPGAELPPLPR